MSTNVWLLAGEKAFINGAVVVADRNVSLEILNDVPFLLAHQIIQPEETTTPLRQMYFILQTMVIDPRGVDAARDVFDGTMIMMLECFSNDQIVGGLQAIKALVHAGKAFDAIKLLRKIMPVEDMILGVPQHSRVTFLEAV